MAAEYERVSLVKPEVFIYQIPPRSTNRAIRAADWNLASPNWRGRMRIVTKGEKCFVKLEDKHSGELFATCPVDKFPGVAVEPVSDSSRYFVLRLLDPSGQHAFVGLGFEDRGDAFDFNVALQDHFKQVTQSKRLAEEEAKPQPHKDYSLKAGEKIHINFGKTSKGSGASDKTKPMIGLSASGGLLPPPASTVRPINPLPGSQGPWNTPPQQQQQPKQSGDEWGDFASFSSEQESSSKEASGGTGNWVQF